MSVHTYRGYDARKGTVTLLFCAQCDADDQEGSFGFSIEGAMEHLTNLGPAHNLFKPGKAETDFAKIQGWIK